MKKPPKETAPKREAVQLAPSPCDGPCEALRGLKLCPVHDAMRTDVLRTAVLP